MLTLVPGGMGGSETYARALTRLLPSNDELETCVFVPANARGFSEGIPETVVDSVTAFGSSLGRVLNLMNIGARRSSISAKFRDADVVHYPLTVMVPPAKTRQATVQTLLDLQHLELPSLFSRPEMVYRKYFYERAAAHADVVITISDFTKRRIVELLGIPAERVVVSHLGVDLDAFRPNTGVRENFVLYPARGWRHKNHFRLIEAVELLRRTDESLRLVLTGGGLESLGDLPRWVDRRGLVGEEELRSLYSSAGVLAFPSLYEGFGLPPLEAMASGCPVAAANVGSIPEVVGKAAILFDPFDSADIARGIAEAFARAAQLTVAGLENASRFTWESCAISHAKAYSLAIDLHGVTLGKRQ